MDPVSVTEEENVNGDGEGKCVEEVTEKPQVAKVGDEDAEKMSKDEKVVNAEEEIEEKDAKGGDHGVEEKKGGVEGENVEMDVEPKTGVSFPVKLADGKQLMALGVRRKKVIALNINIYAFGVYADNTKLKELLKAKFGKAPSEPTKELYETVINSDIGMKVRLIIVFKALTMNMVRKNFNEGLGASLKKLKGGQKDDELVNKVMGAAKDSIKLSAGSVIEITRLPGYILQMKVKDEQISEVESELLCRAYFDMYLGDDPFDKEAKERFGKSLLNLF